MQVKSLDIDAISSLNTPIFKIVWFTHKMCYSQFWSFLSYEKVIVCLLFDKFAMLSHLMLSHNISGPKNYNWLLVFAIDDL